ncbi:MAG: hypothetical protein WAM53_01350 [Terrimicrobiaceae bacterium]
MRNGVPLLAAIAIGLFAGLRTSELAALDWQDVAPPLLRLLTWSDWIG